MEDTVILKLIKNATDETDEDILSAFLEMAREVIIAKRYCNTITKPTDEEKEEYLAAHTATQVNVATYLLNKRGAEGELHHSENGTLRIYSSAGVPDEMTRDIIPLAEVF